VPAPQLLSLANGMYAYLKSIEKLLTTAGTDAAAICHFEGQSVGQLLLWGPA
jgi:hypothetical protein